MRTLIFLSAALVAGAVSAGAQLPATPRSGEGVTRSAPAVRLAPASPASTARLTRMLARTGAGARAASTRSLSPETAERRRVAAARLARGAGGPVRSKRP